MRSATHTHFGEPADVLAITDAPLPEPGAGQVRIRTLLAPIHNHDLWTIRGQYGDRPALPAIAGSEAVGTIDALGEGVEGLRIGQRVNAASGRGTWAEAFVAPAKMVIPLPDAIPDAIAAQLVAMPLSALMLLDWLKLEPGACVVQNAANGAVGKALAMLGAARGLRVLSLVRRAAGVEDLAAAGVGDAIAVEDSGWRERAKAFVGSDGARAAIDSVGGESSGDLLPLLGEGGVLVAFGSMSGAAMQLPPGPLIFRHLELRGFWGSKVSREMAKEDRRRLVGELLQRAAAGELRLPVDATYDLADVRDAVVAAQRAGKGGKVLLKP